ncbi:Inositol hexaphosphate kinase KCS1 [Penicillium chermesinum]|uniref:Kinase n=1 Tax=Penicillium chermesinum TaxID=63820 RepID=A0A9W9TYU0_9EURO|nr:Inositol hexaphosphate kinase KCS1 [Penicillium chermesinum]KAJ5246639.1 Inositol hexaphosphate kinase KCS1 [Penicillium chermesinum]
MSNPPPAPEDTLPSPLVTPAAPAQHDCSEDVAIARASPRHHLTRGRHQSQGAQEAFSPSRAESPNVHQWSRPAAPFAVKRSSTVPLDAPLHPDTFYSPQLSERDSLENDRLVNAIPTLNDVPGSPSPPSKVSPHHSYVDPSRMEVDVRRHYPLRSPLQYSSADVSPFSPLRSAVFTADQVKSQEGKPGIRLVPSVPTAEPGTKIDASQGSLAERSLLPSALENVSQASEALASSAPGQDWSLFGREPFSPFGDPSDSATVEQSVSRGRRGRVDNSIEANLANAEPASNVRSRKSSHYLGLFKENTATSPERKTWDDRTHPQKEGAEPPEPMMGSQLQRANPAMEGEGTLRKSVSLPVLGDAPSMEPQPSAQSPWQAEADDLHKRRPPALPRSLLEEIRNFHLTPGGRHGSSFSKSIPTQYSERGRDYFQQQPHVERFPEFSPSEEDTRRDLARIAEEECNEEQISSAVYFPHERVNEPGGLNVPGQLSDDPHAVQSIEISAPEPGHELMLVSQERHIPATEKELGRVDISIRSRSESKILHGDLSGLRSPTESGADSLGSIPEHHVDSTCESEASADESNQSVIEESSLTDDAGVTPTATPTQRSRLSLRRKTTGPLGAVELKPYRHQVGGHTTVFRFSRRAVCKQLNNRENEFYERIEKRHPEMLRFLPRYIGVLNVTFSKTSKRVNGNADDPASTRSSRTNGVSADGTQPTEAPEPQRIVSQSQVTGVTAKVVLENNRHIIPQDLFSRQRSRLMDDPAINRPHSADGRDSNSKSSTSRTPQTKKWGATTVNRKLKEQVLREVFSPPAIHHHRRHARGPMHLARATSDIQNPPSISDRHGSLPENGLSRSNPRSSAMSKRESLNPAAKDIISSSRDGLTLSSSASTALDENRNSLESPTHENDSNRTQSLNRGQAVRRRHSGGGLQRRISMDSKPGDLMFFDDEGYGGDKEDDIFSMESDAPVSSESTAVRPTVLSRIRENFDR